MHFVIIHFYWKKNCKLQYYFFNHEWHVLYYIEKKVYGENTDATENKINRTTVSVRKPQWRHFCNWMIRYHLSEQTRIGEGKAAFIAYLAICGISTWLRIVLIFISTFFLCKCRIQEMLSERKGKWRLKSERLDCGLFILYHPRNYVLSLLSRA